MKNTFNTQKELINYFKDETFCRNYLAEIRWGNYCKPVCPYCKKDNIWNIEGGKRYKCATCKRKFSVTVGTIFEDSKLPLSVWFQAMYAISTSKKGISSLQLASQLGITQKSAWHVNHRIREMIKERKETLRKVVEADETYIGGSEKNKHADKKVKGTEGRSVKTKKPVLGVLQRNGDVIAKVVDNTFKENVEPFITENVEQYTTIVTDEYYSYNDLKRLGYKHLTVNHSAKEYVKGTASTNALEGFWSLLKRGLYGIYHSVSQKHLQAYVNEFAGRYNSRQLSNSERFDMILKKSEGNLSYNKLTGKPTKQQIYLHLPMNRIV